jgi:hypothetical protein
MAPGRSTLSWSWSATAGRSAPGPACECTKSRRAVKKAREAVQVESPFPEVEKQSLVNNGFEAVKPQPSTIIITLSVHNRLNANISSVLFEKIQRLTTSPTGRWRSAPPDSVLLSSLQDSTKSGTDASDSIPAKPAHASTVRYRQVALASLLFTSTAENRGPWPAVKFVFEQFRTRSRSV